MFIIPFSHGCFVSIFIASVACIADTTAAALLSMPLVSQLSLHSDSFTTHLKQ